MNNKFSEQKVTQATAYLIRKAGGRMDVMKLIKLLYLAERASLIGTGRPMTFDAYFSLPYGPVLSTTLDLINSVSSEKTESGWAKHWHSVISDRLGNNVQLIGEYSISELSAQEMQTLDEVWSKYGHLSPVDLSKLSHELPEYKDPGGSREPISVRDILVAGGFSADEASEVEEDIIAEAAAAHAFEAHEHV